MSGINLVGSRRSSRKNVIVKLLF